MDGFVLDSVRYASGGVRRTFEHKGLYCVEGVFTDADGKSRLYWALSPMEAIEVNGVRNYLVQVDFETGNEEAARKVAESEFDKLHKL